MERFTWDSHRNPIPMDKPGDLVFDTFRTWANKHVE